MSAEEGEADPSDWSTLVVELPEASAAATIVDVDGAVDDVEESEEEP